MYAALERQHQPAELDPPHPIERAENQVHFVFHGHQAGGHQVRSSSGIRWRNEEGRREYIVPGRLQGRLFQRWARAGLQESLPESASSLCLRAGKQMADVADLFILEEPAHELSTRILVLRVPMPRQEHLGLDVDEPGRHLDEFSGVVQILGFDPFDGGQELTGDPGDGDFEDIDVLLTDEVQQQVERPLKALDVDDEKVLLLEGTLGDG